MPEYFDIHSHPYFPDYDTDRDEVIAHMKERGIWTCSIGTDVESSRKSVELAKKYENVFASVGVHPDESSHEIRDKRHEGDYQDLISNLESLISSPRVVAIGECGFDFFRTKEEDKEKTKKVQTEIFQKQIDLALKHEKSLMIHARPTKGTMDAYEETLNVLEPLAKEHGDKLFGNLHFFVGDLDILRRFLDIGFTVSFTGVITFASDYNDSIRFAPLDMIHAETDAPFVAPVLHRGKRNSSEYVDEIVRAIALIRSENIEVVKTALVENAKRLFRLT